jgi:hypothetical protein
MSSVLWSKNAITVNILSLEDIYARYNIDDCNFIKIDIEGGEADALSAAKEVLKKFHPTLYLSLHLGFLIKDFLNKIVDALSIYKNIYDMWK